MAEARVFESEILTRKEASDYLKHRWHQRVSAQTLAIYAHEGKGPAYRVIAGSGSFYERSKLDLWAKDRMLSGKVA